MINLDMPDVAALERLLAELNWRHAQRAVDPKLLCDVERVTDEALADERLSLDEAETIRAELAEVAPAVVLESHWRALIPDRPTLGAYWKDRPTRLNVGAEAIAEDFCSADPRRLALIVEESARLFGPDMRRSARHGFEVAKQLGIAPETAQPIIVKALRNLQSNREAHRDRA
jgi:hypothetical protein